MVYNVHTAAYGNAAGTLGDALAESEIELGWDLHPRSQQGPPTPRQWLCPLLSALHQRPQIRESELGKTRKRDPKIDTGHLSVSQLDPLATAL